MLSPTPPPSLRDAGAFARAEPGVSLSWGQGVSPWADGGRGVEPRARAPARLLPAPVPSSMTPFQPLHRLAGMAACLAPACEAEAAVGGSPVPTDGPCGPLRTFFDFKLHCQWTSLRFFFFSFTFYFKRFSAPKVGLELRAPRAEVAAAPTEPAGLPRFHSRPCTLASVHLRGRVLEAGVAGR